MATTESTRPAVPNCRECSAVPAYGFEQRHFLLAEFSVAGLMSLPTPAWQRSSRARIDVVALGDAKR